MGVSKLHDEETRLQLQDSIRDRLQHSDLQVADTSAEDQWVKIKLGRHVHGSVGISWLFCPETHGLVRRLI